MSTRPVTKPGKAGYCIVSVSFYADDLALLDAFVALWKKDYPDASRSGAIREAVKLLVENTPAPKRVPKLKRNPCLTSAQIRAEKRKKAKDETVRSTR